MSDSIVFVAAKRTPFGKFGGALSQLSATDLGVEASKGALASANISPKAVDHVVFGNVLHTSNDAAYLARHIGLKCEIPTEVPAVTLNRLCGSGFESICYGVRLLKLGEAKVVLAGGTENLSQAPYVLRKARFGYRMNHGELEDSLVAGLYDTVAEMAMSATAERLAEAYGIDRLACDTFAHQSHERATKATQENILKEEMTPIEIQSRKKTFTLDCDEHIRQDSTLESLQKLPPVFKKGGTITAGNASGICDGAAATVLTTKSIAQSENWTILGEWVDSFVVGVDPKIMGIGPVNAIKGVLDRTGLPLSEMKRIEVNEAFAPQYLAVEKELGLNREITNAEGGAIAIGHPLAASGTRLTSHVLYRLGEVGGGFGIASACIGGGQGLAVIVRV